MGRAASLHEFFGSACSTLDIFWIQVPSKLKLLICLLGWDRAKRGVKAQGLLSVMKSSSFLVAFITVKNGLEIIKTLTVKLQKRDIDIVSAFGLIDNTKEEVNAIYRRLHLARN